MRVLILVVVEVLLTVLSVSGLPLERAAEVLWVGALLAAALTAGF
ncbi:hypothetical protein [Kitasatospora sp. NA04385]|nr:hypothetical protein [Kitasatospora sp. NA04385]